MRLNFYAQLFSQSYKITSGEIGFSQYLRSGLSIML